MGDGHLYPVAFLNNLDPPGFPPHSLRFKVNTPAMLLRNLNPSAGLLNGTRLLIKTLNNRVIENKSWQGHNTDNNVFIPRITLTTTKDSKLQFTLSRRHFPSSLMQWPSTSRTNNHWKKSIYLNQCSSMISSTWRCQEQHVAVAYIAHLLNHQMKTHATQKMSCTNQL